MRLMKLIGGVAVAASVMVLVGCANSMEQTSKALEAMPERTCSYESESGETLRAEGAACSELIGSVAENQARKACAEFSEKGEGMCLMALALNKRAQGDGRRDTARDLLVAAIRADSNIKSAWIGTVPVLGGILGQAHREQQRQDTLQEAFANAGPSVGSVSIGADAGASGEEGASGAGEASGNTVVIGNESNSIQGDGNVVNEGRNPTTVGTGQPEGALNPETNFNNDAPSDAAPQVSGAEDSDGGQSIIPRP